MNDVTLDRQALTFVTVMTSHQPAAAAQETLVKPGVTMVTVKQNSSEYEQQHHRVTSAARLQRLSTPHPQRSFNGR